MFYDYISYNQECGSLTLTDDQGWGLNVKSQSGMDY